MHCITDPISLLGVMCQREQLPAVVRIAALTEAAESRPGVRLALTPEAVRLLIDNPPVADLIEQSAASATESGSVAGEILLFLLSASEHHPQHASIRRALKVRQWDAGQGQKNYGGQPVNYSERTARYSWVQFKPVCHLWAAWNLQMGVDRSAVALMDAWRNIIADAEWLRMEAASRRLRDGTPILSASDVVQLELPPNLPPARFTSIPPLPAPALDFLATYTPTRSAS